MNKINVSDILNKIDDVYMLIGDQKKSITKAKPILEADADSISFIEKTRKDKIELLNKSKAGIIIIDDSMKEESIKYPEILFIVVENPRIVFAGLIKKLFSPVIETGIHSSVVIHPNAVIDQDVFIGPFTYIGKCTIKKNSIIYGHCHIYDNVVIGENVIINAGCSIGADGFGYFLNKSEELENFPHIGGVVIEDDVHIGANTCIDRGALGNTIIRKGAKIDNLVHIAHNVEIGRNSMIIADAMIGGSTKIGHNTWVAPSSVLRDAISIGDNVTIGMGAIITKNIPNGEIWAGNPGCPAGI